MKKVSVIMPIYNVDKYLDRSIDSLLRQTLEDIEIILIDDGSTDHSKEIIKKYQQRYPDAGITEVKVNYIWKDNGIIQLGGLTF